MELDFDVLISVIPYIFGSSDLVAYGRTCRTLNLSVATELLRRGVSFPISNNFASFLAFIEAAPDGNPRAPHLKHLAFDLWVESLPLGEDTAMMARILEACSSLTSFRLRCGRLLDVDPRIGAALVKLEHLQSLELENVGGVASLTALLVSMRSRCRKVQLSYTIDEDDDDPDDLPLVNPDPNLTLLSFAPSLQTLYLECPALQESTIIYPHLTNLHIVDWTDFDVIPLLRTFPNLERLSLASTNTYIDDDFRDSNMAALQQSPWRNLSKFEGTIHDLFALGLIGPLRAWFMADELTSHSTPELTELMVLSESLQLQQIHVSFTMLEGDTVFAELLDVLWSTLSDTLSHLELYIRAEQTDPEDISRWLGKIKTFCRRAGLRYVEMTFIYREPTPHNYDGLPTDPHTITQCRQLHEYFLERGDARSLALEFFNHAPTLRYFTYRVMSNVFCWEADRDAVGVEVVGRDARAVKVAEGMDSTDDHSMIGWVTPFELHWIT